MKKKLYYVVEYQCENVGEILECNGIKRVTVYTMENNEPKQIAILEILVDQNCEEEINGYLDDNGFGDEIFTLVQL